MFYRMLYLLGLCFPLWVWCSPLGSPLGFSHVYYIVVYMVCYKHVLYMYVIPPLAPLAILPVGYNFTYVFIQ